MFPSNSGSTSAVWLAMLAFTATAALAAKSHLDSEEATGSAPATPTVAAPVLEHADLEEPRRFSVELRQPSMKLPAISRDDYANALVDRLLAAAPADVAVEAPGIVEPRFEDPAVLDTELPRPDRPELPAVRP